MCKIIFISNYKSGAGVTNTTINLANQFSKLGNDAMSNKEIESLDNIGEKQCGYVFTKDFLINWDGFLNIIPLSKITKLEYISYFYLLVYGTRLRITADKKYNIWSYAPTKDEWIRRGFVSPSGKGDINMNVQTPV